MGAYKIYLVTCSKPGAHKPVVIQVNAKTPELALHHARKRLRWEWVPVSAVLMDEVSQ